MLKNTLGSTLFFPNTKEFFYHHQYSCCVLHVNLTAELKKSFHSCNALRIQGITCRDHISRNLIIKNSFLQTFYKYSLLRRNLQLKLHWKIMLFTTKKKCKKIKIGFLKAYETWKRVFFLYRSYINGFRTIFHEFLIESLCSCQLPSYWITVHSGNRIHWDSRSV